MGTRVASRAKGISVISADGQMDFDWKAVALRLADDLRQGVVLLDSNGVVIGINHSFEAALGWKRTEVAGKPWTAVAGAVPQVDLSDMLRGAFDRVDLPAVSGDGQQLMLSFEVSHHGAGGATGIVARLVSYRPMHEQNEQSRDLAYEISDRPEDFGMIHRAWFADAGTSVASFNGRRCYEVLYGLERPCEHCPVKEPGALPRSLVEPAEDQKSFKVTTLRKLDEATVRVSVVHHDPTVLGKMVGAKLETLSKRSHLSERERDVLSKVVLGKSFDDIAGDLGISVRTVKFHQANVLQKLGADSRVDLLRLLF